ncbi:hypothetical protein XENOCAPTIV_030352 [Xenoophorus captivus]|uniref:Uncharacterized protein n=1 Tax=Xenoophorus captivus TaxID=1517983 RepID=A0ABV0RVX7_9TELE
MQTSVVNLSYHHRAPTTQLRRYLYICFPDVSMAVTAQSMLPDVVDDFRLINPYSKGHEAIFYSFYVFFIKLAAGITLGVSTLCLE